MPFSRLTLPRRLGVFLQRLGDAFGFRGREINSNGADLGLIDRKPYRPRRFGTDPYRTAIEHFHFQWVCHLGNIGAKRFRVKTEPCGW